MSELEAYKAAFEKLKEAILVIAYNNPQHEEYFHKRGIDPAIIAKPKNIGDSHEAKDAAFRAYLRVLDNEIAEISWLEAVDILCTLKTDS